MERFNRIENAEDYTPDSAMEPYRQLLLQVLYRAVVDFFDDVPLGNHHNASAKHRNRVHAEMFFFSEVSDDDEVPWTFAWIAGHLYECPWSFMEHLRAYLRGAPMRSQLDEAGRKHFSQRFDVLEIG